MGACVHLMHFNLRPHTPASSRPEFLLLSRSHTVSPKLSNQAYIFKEAWGMKEQHLAPIFKWFLKQKTVVRRHAPRRVMAQALQTMTATSPSRLAVLLAMLGSDSMAASALAPTCVCLTWRNVSRLPMLLGSRRRQGMLLFAINIVPLKDIVAVHYLLFALLIWCSWPSQDICQTALLLRSGHYEAFHQASSHYFNPPASLENGICYPAGFIYSIKQRFLILTVFCILSMVRELNWHLDVSAGSHRSNCGPQGCTLNCTLRTIVVVFFPVKISLLLLVTLYSRDTGWHFITRWAEFPYMLTCVVYPCYAIKAHSSNVTNLVHKVRHAIAARGLRVPVTPVYGPVTRRLSLQFTYLQLMT